MNWQSVSSKKFTQIGYDVNNSTLYVKTHSGEEIIHPAVPNNLYAELKRANLDKQFDEYFQLEIYPVYAGISRTNDPDSKS